MRTATVLLLLAVAASAQEVTRVDLGLAYMRLDRAYRDHRPADPVPVNKAVDYVARDFFRGEFAAVLRRLDEQTAALRPDGARPPGVRVRVVPRVFRPGERAIAKVSEIYPDGRLWVLQLRVHGKVIWRTRVDGDVKLPAFGAGDYVVELVSGEGPAWEATRCYVTPFDLDALREDNARQLAGPGQTLAALRARNDLARIDASERASVEFLANPVEMAVDTTFAIRAWRQFDVHPFAARSGDYWRVVQAGNATVPMRVYAPAGKGPRPLIIALHGAGADENMFFMGYGAGRLKELADEHGFVVVTPSTYAAANPKFLDTILAVVTSNYRIDRKRIYVLGHSLGAMAASGFARRGQIAAAACLAGGAPAAKVAPTLIIAAELDAIVPAARLRQAYERARAAGAPVEFRLEKRVGHTLMVGDVLPDAVTWLLRHER